MSLDIRLVCFDLGRVLVRICDTWQHAAQVARLSGPLPQLDDSARSTLRQFVFAAEMGKLDLDGFCREAGTVFGVDPKNVRAMSDIFILGVFPGTRQLLEDIAARGITTACLSNTNDNHWRIIFDNSDPDYRQLDPLNHRFGSHLIGLRKPDAKIYEHVEQAIGLRGEQIVFFDDMPENIEGARKRGWHAEMIGRDSDPIQQMRGHLLRFGLLSD